MKLLPIVFGILREQDAESASSNVTDILNRFKILRLVLEDLLTSGSEDAYSREDDLTKLISDISIITFKPTTFGIKFKNGSKMNLKYDPTPMQLKSDSGTDSKAKDYFQLQILGKRYNLQNRSEYLQALDYIGKALDEKPIGTTDNQASKDQNQELPDEQPNEEPEEQPSEENDDNGEE